MIPFISLLSIPIDIILIIRNKSLIIILLHWRVSCVELILSWGFNIWILSCIFNRFFWCYYSAFVHIFIIMITQWRFINNAYSFFHLGFLSWSWWNLIFIYLIINISALKLILRIWILNLSRRINICWISLLMSLTLLKLKLLLLIKLILMIYSKPLIILIVYLIFIIISEIIFFSRYSFYILNLWLNLIMAWIIRWHCVVLLIRALLSIMRLWASVQLIICSHFLVSSSILIWWGIKSFIITHLINYYINIFFIVNILK